MTPLHVAAEKGDRLDIVQYLIGEGADINIKDSCGVSETYVASYSGSYRVGWECSFSFQLNLYCTKAFV